MAEQQIDAQDNHPAPQRGEVGLGALWLGIAGVPTAWISLELFSYVLTTALCDEKNVASANLSAATATAWHTLLPANLIAVAVALAAAAVALNNWRRTRDENPGSPHNLLEVGEGRARFLAMFGLLTSIGFLAAFVFSVATLLLVPLCK